MADEAVIETRQIPANKLKAGWELLKLTFTEWTNDNAFELSAALAFYTIFSIAPVLLIAVGVASFFLARDTATDPIARRWSHQFPLGTNVEMVATLTPGSLWGNFLVASHGSPYDYDSNVPIIFYGPGIPASRRSEFVRTVDIAPTLAALLSVKPLEKLDGVPLSLNHR